MLLYLEMSLSHERILQCIGMKMTRDLYIQLIKEIFSIIKNKGVI